MLFRSQVRCDERPEMIHPASDRLIRDPNRALREPIFDVAQTPREPEIEPNSLLKALSRWLSIGALWLFWLDGEKRRPLILLMWVEGLPPLLTSNKCQRDNALRGASPRRG